MFNGKTARNRARGAPVCTVLNTQIIACTNSATYVPIHTFFPKRYNEIFSNVEMHDDGEWWNV